MLDFRVQGFRVQGLEFLVRVFFAFSVVVRDFLGCFRRGFGVTPFFSLWVTLIQGLAYPKSWATVLKEENTAPQIVSGPKRT